MSYDSTTVTPRRASIPLLLGTFLLLACAGAGEDRPRPNVLLLSIDALRADHLGVYGYAAAETPALDGFASRGVRFENAISQASWTLPSVTSLFLSQYPSTHGVQSPRQRLSADAETLALLMRNGGYRTAALMMGAYTSAEFGMDRGFESFRANTGRMPEKNQLALDWIDSTEEPFFLYMHYVDVHHPYNSRNPYAADRERRKYSVSGKTPLGKLRTSLTPEGLEELIAQYDAGVSYADYHFGEFIQALDERGLLERTVILVTADHGEAFLEHDRRLGHRGPPFEEQVRVPLLVVGPSIPSGVAVAEPVQAIDLAPTILALAGIPAGEGMQGRELLSDGQPVELDGSIAFSQAGPVSAVRTLEWKLLYNSRDGSARLSHLKEDPGEAIDVSSEYPDVRRNLESALADLLRANGELAGSSQVEKATPGEETLQQLEALGYVDRTSGKEETPDE